MKKKDEAGQRLLPFIISCFLFIVFHLSAAFTHHTHCSAAARGGIAAA